MKVLKSFFVLIFYCPLLVKSQYQSEKFDTSYTITTIEKIEGREMIFEKYFADSLNNQELEGYKSPKDRCNDISEVYDILNESGISTLHKNILQK